MSLEAVAEEITRDVVDGVDGVRAGIIGEIGISKDFTAEEEKVLRGAARAQHATGVPLEVHLPGWERHGERVLDVVAEEGGDLRRTVLCHMNPSGHDFDYQVRLAERGAWLEYDMIGMDYFYADQQAQSPSDEENARALLRLRTPSCSEASSSRKTSSSRFSSCAMADRLRSHSRPLRAAAASPRLHSNWTSRRCWSTIRAGSSPAETDMPQPVGEDGRRKSARRQANPRDFSTSRLRLRGRESRHEETVALLQELVRVPSVNPYFTGLGEPSREGDVQDILADRLERLGARSTGGSPTPAI